jgi:hypothetical protein
MTDHAERLQPGGFRVMDDVTETVVMKCPDQRCVWFIPAIDVALGTLFLIAKDHLRRPIVEEGLEP